MPADIVIKGGTVYDGSGAPGRAADVAITAGIIVEIGPNLSGARELDATGCAVTPGFIDIHAHLREPGQSYKETIASGTGWLGLSCAESGECGAADFRE